MSNILIAISNIVNHHNINQANAGNANNRVNAMGDQLEAYIQEVFSSSTGLNEDDRLTALSRTFSYRGNNTNPPDAMIRGGDAIEVKKLESFDTELQLNSSYPKSKLKSSNPSISQNARNCEQWSEKDILYCIGTVKTENRAKKLKRLWMIYGDCFCADDDVYSNVRAKLIEGINAIDGLTFSETKELGRINNVDPLSYTNLRIRGMWLLKNPNKIYINRVAYDPTKDFQLFVLMKTEKYDSLDENDKNRLINIQGLRSSDIRLENPNNPAELIDCKLITYTT